MTDLEQLKSLAGIAPQANCTGVSAEGNHVIAGKKAEFMKENNIKPGTPEWFKLWFAKPELTGEDPFGGKR